MTLMRRNLYDPFYNMQLAMDRMMRAPFDGDVLQPGDANVLAVDMTSNDKEIIIRADLPGFREDEVKVDVRGSILNISAETKTQREDRQANWLIRELRYGKFARSVVLPEEVITDKADASLNNGVLTVRLPKRKPNPVQQIVVKARNLLKGGSR